MRNSALFLLLFSPLYGWGQAITAPMQDIKNEAVPQAAEPATSSTQLQDLGSKKEGERIEVTGSHIKRLDTEGASPVSTITRKDLEKSGYNSISDVLRDNAANSFGSARETTNSNTPGNAEVNLRGLGADNTLVLLNGQRLPSDAVDGAVDLSMIPMAAVERIEILKDGASAIYGSDALGGVVNIITRKDFTGSEISLAQTTPDQPGGKKTDISLVNGINHGRLNMVNVAQYRDNSAVFSRDRPWSNNGVSNIGSSPSYTTAAGTSAVGPNCPPSQVKHTSGGDVCTYKYSNDSTEIPNLKQFGLLTETNYELNSKVKLTGRLSGTQRNVQTELAPAPGGLTIPKNVANTLGPNGGPLAGADPTQDLNITYRAAPLGNRRNYVDTYAYNALLGTTVQLSPEWTVDVTGATNRVMTNNRGVGGYALSQSIVDAIVAHQCNPFDPTVPCNLGSAAYTTQEKMSTILTSGDVKATGELAKWDAGTLSVAVGSTFTYQSYQDAFDDQSVAGNVYGGAGSSGGGQRNTSAAYSEFSIPLTKKLELQVAGRYDSYSDFGSTVNPKAAILFHANKSLLFRASAGTGFKAPLMQELYAATSSSYPSFIDHKGCADEVKNGQVGTDCVPQQHLVTSSGNTGLKEERSVSYSVGSVYEPTKDFNISTDFFQINNKNVVGIDYEDLTLAEAQGVNVGQYGVVITRDPVSHAITNITAPLQNLTGQQLEGFDVSSSLRLGKFKLSTEQSQMFFFKQQGFPGTAYRNRLGENGLPPWRNATGVSYTPHFRHEVGLVALTTAGQEKAVVTAGNLRNYTELDLMYSYKSKNYGTWSAGVKNVMGTTPPLDDSNPTAMLNTSIYDQIGRQYFTGYKATF